MPLCVSKFHVYVSYVQFFISEKTSWTLFCLFVINLGHKDLKLGKNHTPGYLVPTKYEYLNHYDETANTADVLYKISTSSSEKGEEMLLAMLHDSKIIFPEDYSSV